VTASTDWPAERVAAPLAWSIPALSSAAVVLAVGIAPGAQIYPVLFGGLGALIAMKLPHHPVGWLMLFVGACFAANALALQWAASGRVSGAVWGSWWAERGSAVIVPATLLFLLLLPDGRLPSPRWRPIVIGVVAAQLLVVTLWCRMSGAMVPAGEPGQGALQNPLGVLPEGWRPVLDPLELVLIVPFLLVLPAVVQRVRVPCERPPAVSVLVGMAVFVLLVTVPDLVWPAASQWFHIVGAMVLLGAILAAVMRGRFDGLQVVVSQALVYGVMSAAVLVAYVALVGATARIGAPDALAGILTAGVAVALLPARRYLQSGLQRAMYGEGGEPQRALRRLATSVADSDDLPGVLHGLAHSVRVSLRVPWVEAEFRGCVSGSGEPPQRGSVEEFVLSGGDGESGVLRVGLTPGRSLRDSERELLSDLADQGARAARVVCLAADLAHARRMLVESREQERSRLRRELHDDLGPILAGLAMQLGSLPELVTADVGLATSRLVRLEEEARAALERTRHISRDLRPSTLDELGLSGALVEAGQAVGVRVHLTGDTPAGLSPAVEVAAYRIVAEAALNAQRHAHADAIDVALRLSDGRLEMVIIDHGPGMRDAGAGVGLRSMRERAAELGGAVEFLPTPGGGVTVRAELPVTDEEVEVR
jgi:two-component system, NarL family, sensor kinase